jgi:para-aminobenzoate synthetase component 1
MTLEEFTATANAWGARGKPFLFLFDFELKKPVLFPLEALESENIFYQLPDSTHEPSSPPLLKPSLDLDPPSYESYLMAYERVKKNLQSGNTYLLNLTFPTRIKSDANLRDLYAAARAPYKLYYKDQFILFSPECFVRTDGGFIYTYPMKGTIPADLPDARRLVLADRKETWEHNTIVDLLRNDLAIVAEQIEVTKFRFITEIHTNQTDLLQVSSEIRGTLPSRWQETIGTLLVQLLPAGSISGAPKQKTVDLIAKAEKMDRGYFTGIFGVFDGINLDSAVNIRFIEKTEQGLQFRSGGGITADSDPRKEYEELIQKVYIPC